MNAVDVMNHTLTALLDSQKPTPAKRDPDLRWHDFDDLGDREWVLQVGYTVEIDDGNVLVWIHKASLNTGQRDIELMRDEIDVNAWEAALVIEETARLDAEAQEHGYDRDDRGDWLYEQRKDREASR